MVDWGNATHAQVTADLSNCWSNILIDKLFTVLEPLVTQLSPISRYIRAQHYRYQYTPLLSESNALWNRKYLKPYMPHVSLPQLKGKQWHCAIWTVHFAVHTVLCALHTAQCTWKLQCYSVKGPTERQYSWSNSIVFIRVMRYSDTVIFRSWRPVQCTI